MKLSYIVPAYNVSQYIEKCIKSVINQKIPYQDFEIIVVNDGSTDNTLEILHKIKTDNKEVNISIINQQNSGQSIARNKALTIAKGKYIWYVDSDDYISKNTAKDLLTIAEKYEVDMLWFHHRLVDEYDKELPLPQEDVKIAPHLKLMSGKAFLSKYFKNSCMPCMFLFRREYLERIELTFEPDRYFEDILYTSTALDKADKAMYADICAYNYLIRTIGSTMRDEKKAEKRIQDGLYIASKLKEYRKTANVPVYFDTFASMITMYNLRRSSKISKDFFDKNYENAWQMGLLPVYYYGKITTKITQFLCNTLGRSFYYIAKKMN